MMAPATSSTAPIATRVIAIERGLDEIAPDAGNAENRLDHHRTGHHRRRRRPEIGYERNQCGAERVGEHDAGAAGHRRAAVREDGAASASTIAARVSRATAAICGAASTTTGSTRLRGAPSPQPPTGSIFEPEAEDELQQRRDDEIRDRDAEARGRRHRDRRAAPARAPPPARPRRRRRRARAPSAIAPSAAETGRARANNCATVKSRQIIARPEIAARERAEIVEILPPQRLVEPIDPAQVLHHGGIERPLEIERPARRGAHRKKDRVTTTSSVGIAQATRAAIRRSMRGGLHHARVPRKRARRHAARLAAPVTLARIAAMLPA